MGYEHIYKQYSNNNMSDIAIFVICFINFAITLRFKAMKKIINQSDYKENRWSGGITRELLILPQGSSLSERNFDIRISSAVINLTKSVFSDFTNYKRYILPVEGSITLYIDNKEYPLNRDVPFEFDGSESVCSQNSVNAVDFNVICRKELNVNVAVLSKGKSNKQNATFIFALEDIVINNMKVNKYNSIILDEPYQFEGKAIVVENLLKG